MVTNAGAQPAVVSAALTRLPDPRNAPLPANGSEQLVFAQLYETLLRIDCLGSTAPGLAERWRADDGGREWVLTLRKGARFWDGAPVTATDVVNAWMAPSARLSPAWAGSSPLSVVASGERELRIVQRAANPKVPRWLADPALAVVRAAENGAWPQGTGPYRVEDPAGQGQSAPSGGLRLVPAFPVPDGGQRGRPVLDLSVVEGGDGRDPLDLGIDLTVSRDPRVLAYADSRAEYRTSPLPWDRTYVLAVPGRISGREPGGTPSTEPIDPVRRSVARDAVRGEARAAVEPSWWGETSGCGREPGWPGDDHRESSRPRLEGRGAPGGDGPQGGVATSRIVYAREDGIAREVAERLVALAAQRPGAEEFPRSAAWLAPLTTARPPVVAAGLSRGELTSALSTGRDLGYVLWVPSRAAAPCGEWERIRRVAPWLEGRPLGEAFVPIVESRPRVVYRAGLALGLTVDVAAVLRIGQPPRAR